MLRRLRRRMPNQETEMNAVELNENLQEAAASDAAAAETATVPQGGEAGAESAAAELPTVPRAEYEQLKTERDQLVDRVARLQAEFENARKRAEREKAEYRDYAAASIVEQFLPVLDNFELALKATGSTE
jgi:molecular chaperone GrpE